MKVILISGKAGSGKDSTAKIMRSFLMSDGKSVLITHYADVLKFVCQHFFNWDGEKDKAGRRLLQYVGTDLVRSQDPNFWADFLASMLKFFNGRWDYVIIPDTRFPNEIEVMKKGGFDTMHVRIDRPNLESKLTDEQKRHISETAMDAAVPDCRICNDGTLSELADTVRLWIKEELYE